uniref:Shikimate dehydrogenase (NADP(+)) n=1 Tax=Verrucosispora sp. TaxID=1871626 RepID=A0A894JN67_9ACTN|nr:shikimate 5-dehydrogenase [Verrucosispora sp.]
MVPDTPGPARCLIGLIGTDVHGSLSPALHEAEADRRGIRLFYRTVDVREAVAAGVALPELVRSAPALGFTGLNVTHPCKQQVVPLMDRLSPEAAALGAVNTVTFTGAGAMGHNTDWWGFAMSLDHELPDARRDRVLLLGAGGAGAAVGHALLHTGTMSLYVTDSIPQRADELATAFNDRFGPGRATAVDATQRTASEVDGIVNATPVGMAQSPGMPLPAEQLRPGVWVADIIYRPLETALLAAARAAGCRTLNGVGMLAFQAAAGFRLFTGVEPDPVRMLADLRRATGRPEDRPDPR